MSETYDKIGWYYGWNGGDRPIHPDAEVEVVLRSGKIHTRRAIDFPSWGHIGTDNDIIAFCVKRRQPREWWVNQRMDGSIALYRTRAEAISELGETVQVREVLPETSHDH